MKDDFSGSKYRISYAFLKQIFIYQNYTIKLIDKERINRITTLLLIIVVDNREHLFISRYSDNKLIKQLLKTTY